MPRPTTPSRSFPALLARGGRALPGPMGLSQLGDAAAQLLHGEIALEHPEEQDDDDDQKNHSNSGVKHLVSFRVAAAPCSSRWAVAGF